MGRFLIKGQDGETGVIFENMDSWDIIDSYGKYEIAFYSKGIKWGVGKYSTKSKAKKVIDIILTKYASFYIFQMPLDSEVE